MNAPNLLLRVAEPHELIDCRFHLLLSRLVALGIAVDEIEHLELGDVALPLDVLERIVDAAHGPT